MKKIKKITLTIIALCIAKTCLADLPVACGWYAEGNIGLTKIKNTNFGSNVSLTNSGFGFNVNGGYKFIPFFAGEVGFTAYTEAKIKSSQGGSGSIQSGAFDIAGKAILPIGITGTQLFTKLGVATLSSKISVNKKNTGLTVSSGTNTATNYYLGAGAEYAYTSNIMLVGQWAQAGGNSKTGTFSLYSIGASYIF